MMAVIDLPDEAATAALARRVAALAAAADIIALKGDLGTGKTSFARAFIRASGVRDEPVPSPTFTLVQIYPGSVGAIWHFDLYRLATADEAWELGIEDAFRDGISLIEWPERLGSMLPRDRLEITLEPGEAADARRATLSAGPGWQSRLPEIIADV